MQERNICHRSRVVILNGVEVVTRIITRTIDETILYGNIPSPGQCYEIGSVMMSMNSRKSVIIAGNEPVASITGTWTGICAQINIAERQASRVVYYLPLIRLFVTVTLSWLTTKSPEIERPEII